jgi:hypothetical protein
MSCRDNMLNPETLKKLFGEEAAAKLPKDVIENFIKEIDAVRSAFEGGYIPKAEFNRSMDHVIKELKENAEVKALGKIQDLAALSKIQQRVKSKSFEDNRIEAFKSYITKTKLRGNESSVSFETSTRARELSYIEHLDESLGQTPGLKQIYYSGVLDKEVFIAAGYLKQGQNVPQGITPEAAKIAELIDKSTKFMLKDMRDTKLPIREKESRLVMQTHNTKKMRAMGKEEWVQFVTDLNPDRKFLGVATHDPVVLKRTLEKMYDDRLEGKHSDVDVDGQLANVTDGEVNTNLAGSKLGHRALNFSPENSWKYNQELGMYSSLAQTLNAEIRSTALKVTMYDMFGNNPAKNLDKAIEQEVASLKKEGRFDDAAKLAGAKKRITERFDTVARTNNIPGSETLAKFEKGVGAIETTAKLGLTGIRSAANFANLVSKIQEATGKNIFSSAVTATYASAKSVPKAWRKTFFKDQADVFKLVNDQINSERSGAVAGPLMKLSTFSQKANGQNFLNELFSNAALMTLQKHWGEAITKNSSWKSLAPDDKASLIEAGINEAAFEEILPFAIETASDGTKLLTPEALGRKKLVPKEAVEKYMARAGIKGKPSKVLRDVEVGLRSYIEQMNDFVTTTAGAEERSFLNFGRQSGTPQGTGLSIFTRFKSFTLHAIHSLQKVKNGTIRIDENGNMKSVGNNYVGMAQLATMTAAVAYLADSSITIANTAVDQLIDDEEDWDPLAHVKSPLEAGTWLNALSKSSVGGMYLDIFAGNWDKYDATQTLVGPTFGQITPIYSIYSSLSKAVDTNNPSKQERFTNAAKDEATKIARSYIPFQNMVGIKSALDYAQWDVLYEARHPGSGERRKRRMAREELDRLLEENAE